MLIITTRLLPGTMQLFKNIIFSPHSQLFYFFLPWMYMYLSCGRAPVELLCACIFTILIIIRQSDNLKTELKHQFTKCYSMNDKSKILATSLHIIIFLPQSLTDILSVMRCVLGRSYAFLLPLKSKISEFITFPFRLFKHEKKKKHKSTKCMRSCLLLL